MKRRRQLGKEEQELWSRVAQTAKPLHPKRIVEAPEEAGLLTPPNVPVKEEKRQNPPPKPIAPFKVGEKTGTHARIPDAAKAPVHMDAKAYRKLSQGKLKPEARIDLHGMTVDQAHPALMRFIVGSHAKGLRLVLVITGKGEGPGPTGPLPYQRGILRRQVPHWLAQAPLGPLVLQTAPAGRRHGGEGALYVYLKRHR